MVFTIEARVGSEGKLFGSVTTAVIADAVEAQSSVAIDRRKSEIADQIKTAGQHVLPSASPRVRRSLLRSLPRKSRETLVLNTAGLVIGGYCPAKNAGRARVVPIFIHKTIHMVFHKVVPLSTGLTVKPHDRRRPFHHCHPTNLLQSRFDNVPSRENRTLLIRSRRRLGRRKSSPHNLEAEESVSVPCCLSKAIGAVSSSGSCPTILPTGAPSHLRCGAPSRKCRPVDVDRRR